MTELPLSPPTLCLEVMSDKAGKLMCGYILKPINPAAAKASRVYSCIQSIGWFSHGASAVRHHCEAVGPAAPPWT